MNRVSKIALVALCAAIMAMVMSSCTVGTITWSRLNEQSTQQGAAAAELPDNAVRPPQTQVSNSPTSSVTVLVYMNGSNLESESGEATNDLAEMVAAGTSPNVNVVVQTMGTKKWQQYGISGRKTQRYEVSGKGLTLVDNSLGQLPCTSASTLRDFIAWGAANYPAERYELILWDHGGGPVYGFGYDETGDEDESLTLDEMQKALRDAGVYFDFIGMDCCLMSSLEVCCALYDYCDYTILSEDFESGLGWSYTNWLKALMQNPTMPTPDLGKIIIDDMVKANERDRSWGDDAILALMDEGMMKVLFTAWKDFAYANTNVLAGQNYSMPVSRATGGRDALVDKQRGMFSELLGGYFSESFGEYNSSMSDYYVTDIMAAAQSISSPESKALAAALSEAIVYSRATSGDATLTGLSVTLPYGDAQFYSELQNIFTRCGFDKEYINWLGNFVSASGSYNFYDYDDFSDLWSGWDDYNSFFNWEDWSHADSDEWWNSHWGWNLFHYNDSWNHWYEDNLGHYVPGEGHDPSGYGYNGGR